MVFIFFSLKCPSSITIPIIQEIVCVGLRIQENIQHQRRVFVTVLFVLLISHCLTEKQNKAEVFDRSAGCTGPLEVI